MPESSLYFNTYAYIEIEQLTCGISDADAYQLTVSWTISYISGDYTRIEYQVIGDGDPLEMTDSKVANADEAFVKRGSAVINISKDDIGDVGDVIIVRVLSAKGADKLASGLKKIRVDKLCP